MKLKTLGMLLCGVGLTLGTAGWVPAGSPDEGEGVTLDERAPQPADAEASDARELQRRPRRRRPPRRGRRGRRGGNNGSTSGAKFTHVVTLGDSFSSGTGYHKGPRSYDDHGPLGHHDSSRPLGEDTCYRETQSTPGPRLAKQWGAKSLFAACRGGLIGNVLNQFDSIESELPNKGAHTLITLTISGNDLRSKAGRNWPQTVAKCITNTKKKKACDQNPDHRIVNYATVESRLANVLRMLRDRAPDAEIRILGYPRLMQPNKKCLGVTGINVKEAEWTDARVDELNQTISRAVAKLGDAQVRFVPVESEFAGHGACSARASSRYVNDAVRGQIAYVVKRRGKYELKYKTLVGKLAANYSSFHPSAQGYEAYYQALKGSL